MVPVAAESLNPYHGADAGALPAPRRFAMTELADTLKEALRMTATELPGRVDLSEHGIEPSGRVYRNPTTSLLYTHALPRGDGRLAEGGPLVVDTGAFTGRSPKDKFLVDERGLARPHLVGRGQPAALGGALRGACARR